jgi:heptosyltransferase-1
MPRILIIKTSSLGDVIHNLPVVSDIAAQVPAAEIDWVVEEGFAEIPRLHPRVARVIPAATRRWRGRLWAPSTWREIAHFRRQLQAQSYDVVLDTQGLLKSAVIAWLARGPAYGQDRHTAREPLAARFYDRTFPVARGRHAVVRNRDLAAQALGYALPGTPPDYGIRAPAVTLTATLPRAFILGLHATSRAAKLWPEADWIALGQALTRHGLALVLPWGSSAEERRARAVAAAVKGAQVLPPLTLTQLAVVMDRARAVVGVDTGLVHLAAALGCLTVALYTDTSPVLTGVLAQDSARARNLGERGKPPAVTEVLQVLTDLKAL